jgi:hypothetical protein
MSTSDVAAAPGSIGPAAEGGQALHVSPQALVQELPIGVVPAAEVTGIREMVRTRERERYC